MRILALTYPLTPVGEGACGGTEQVAFQLLRHLARAPRIRVVWIGAEGSRADQVGVGCLSWESLLARYGLLRPRPRHLPPPALADLEQRCNQAVARYLREHAFDVIHNQGASFVGNATSAAPVLFTLHLARRLYPADMWESLRANLHLQCVSRTQQAGYGALACCGVVGNGVDLEQFSSRQRPAAADAPLVYLGRICPEKGPHLAIEVARRARRRLWLVGAVAPFPDHQSYFAEHIAPQLDASIRWLPPPSLAVKRKLLAEAAAVLIPSLIEETSSLVAMEAAASGVPALALRAGALPEVVAHGETGWTASTWEELAAAVPRLGTISPAACRRRAQRDFDAQRMAADYIRLYRQLVSAA